MEKVCKKYLISIISVILSGTLLCGSVFAAQPPEESGQEPVVANETAEGATPQFTIEKIETVPLTMENIAENMRRDNTVANTLDLLPESEDNKAVSNKPWPDFTVSEPFALTDTDKETIKQPSSELDSIYTINPDTRFGELSANSKARAAGADFAIRNLTTNLTQPFPYMNEVTVTFQIVNLGTVAPSRISTDLYIDGDLLTTGEMDYALQPGYGITLTWPLSKLSGVHEIMFQLYTDVDETNYNNNYVRGNYTWVSVVDLAVYSIESDQGNSFESCYIDDTEIGTINNPATLYRTFTIAIANYGSKTANDVEFQVYHNGVVIMSNQNASFKPTFEGQKITLLTLRDSINNAGTLNLGINVDPNRKQGDPDYSNNFRIRSFTVTYDTELFAGKWASAAGLSINIPPDVLSYMTSPSAKGKLVNGDINTAILAWNNISPKVSFNTFTSYEEPYLDAKISFYTDPRLDGYFVALTHLFSGYNEISDVLNDSSVYTKAKIAIASNFIEEFTIEHRTRTITHELGHVLGLKHAYCYDESVMQAGVRYGLDNNLQKQPPKAHDRYNLLKKYS